MPEFERVGVVGAGQMGSGIAEVAARAGCDVIVVESSADALDASRARIEHSLGSALAADKISAQDATAARGRLSYSLDLSALGERDLVVEAIVEKLADKLALFGELDRVLNNEDVVLASNTSSIPIMRLAGATARPEQVLGLHFFNPVPVMPLVEVVACLRTDARVLERAESFARADLGKTVIHARDRAGFVVNGLLVPYLLSAIAMYEAGLASAPDIDAGMEKGCGHPMGPLRLADFIGIDTLVFIADSLYEEYRDARYAPPALARRMVEAGDLGRKSGRGFYDYDR